MYSSNEKKFDSDIMDSISGDSRRIASSLSNTKNPGGSLATGNLLGGGLSKLDNAIQKISRKMEGMSDVVRKNNELIFTEEKKLTNEIESIVIPNDFDVSNFNPINQNHESGEKSNQGKEIKTDAVINQEKLKDYINAAETKLVNINLETDTELQNYDDSSRIKEENMKNISNEMGTEVQDYDSNSSIDNEKLKNINQSNGTKLQQLDDSTSIDAQSLSNIENGDTTEQKFEDNYNKINNLNNMNSLNTSNMTNNIEYDDEYNRLKQLKENE